MALRPSGGFCCLGRVDLRGDLNGPTMQKLCVKPVEDENASSSSSSSSRQQQQHPTQSLSVELSSEMGKWSRDLSPLPKPLSSSDIHTSTKGSDVRVAYQGSPGSFSEIAALKAYPQSVTVPCEQFEVVFKAVELWVVDKAVLPIENTAGGSIHQNCDLLLSHRLHIVGEVQLPVNHCLLALPGVKKEALKRVLSHPQAFLQCETALDKLSIIRENTDDTAAAAKLVFSKNLIDAGAIASQRAAQMYGLNILEKGIQDSWSYLGLQFWPFMRQDCPYNVTRFLILAREPIIPRSDRPFKTSIVFTLEEGSGMLFKALAVFALRKINLTKIESRPQRNRPLRVVDDLNHGAAKYFDYLFHVDFEASMADPRAQNALSHLQEFVTFLRVLGSYPMDAYPL
ncbi:hypothetical protein KSP40_PGU019124 [Platanthera guangdongensis]|uniref:arogenate dehydratase n=1 Tax=Platanthera guangdongensis TaxID=2320717 RepID=A0ABR2LXN7_9ASPA